MTCQGAGVPSTTARPGSSKNKFILENYIPSVLPSPDPSSIGPPDAMLMKHHAAVQSARERFISHHEIFKDFFATADVWFTRALKRDVMLHIPTT